MMMVANFSLRLLIQHMLVVNPDGWIQPGELSVTKPTSTAMAPSFAFIEDPPSYFLQSLVNFSCISEVLVKTIRLVCFSLGMRSGLMKFWWCHARR